MTLAPISRGFNAAVLHMTLRALPQGYDAGPDAPSSYPALRHHFATTGRVKVYDGASDASIFGDPEVNVAFRAWHDWAHLTGGHDFTPLGEARAAGRQADMLRAHYAGHADLPEWLRLLEIEVLAQGWFQRVFGGFPADQRRFARAMLFEGFSATPSALTEARAKPWGVSAHDDWAFAHIARRCGVSREVTSPVLRVIAGV